MALLYPLTDPKLANGGQGGLSTARGSRRRRYKEGGCGVSLCPLSEGSGKGAMPTPNFLILDLKMVAGLQFSCLLYTQKQCFGA